MKGLSTGLSRELVNAIVDSSANSLLDSPARNPARQETNTSAIAVNRMNIGVPPRYDRTEQKRPAWIEIQYCARRLPERNIGSSLDVRSQASSVLDSSQIENHSSHHLYQSVFCSHLVIARLAGLNFNAVEKNYSDESVPRAVASVSLLVAD